MAAWRGTVGKAGNEGVKVALNTVRLYSILFDPPTGFCLAGESSCSL
jgi:hypothetical protein